MTNSASEMMWDSARAGAGPYVECSCGKEFHQEDLDDHDPYDEYDEVEIYDYVEFDALIFVRECNGCSARLAKYENFIWNNRDTIRRYLKVRVDQERERAEHEKVINIMAGIDNED